MAKRKTKNRPYQLRAEQSHTQFQVTGANSQPIVSRLDRRSLSSGVEERANDVPNGDATNPSEQRNFLAGFSQEPIHYPLIPPPPPPPLPTKPPLLPLGILAPYSSRGKSSQTIVETHHVPKVITNQCEVKEYPVQAMMNANGAHPPHRHQQPHIQPHNQPPRDRRHHVTDSTGVNTPNGPMPSHIQVAKPYVFHQAVEACLTDLGVLQAGEDRIRLAGVQWIDNVRKALKLYVWTVSRRSAVFPLRSGPYLDGS